MERRIAQRVIQSELKEKCNEEKPNLLETYKLIKHLVGVE